MTAASGSGLWAEPSTHRAAFATSSSNRRRWFVQMRGIATVEENGRVIGRLPGFFETYVD